MAYAAVISLKQTIQRLLNASHDIAIASSSREIIEFAYKEVTSLQQVLKRLDDSSSSSKRLNDLDRQIGDAVHKLEDLLEFEEANQFPSESENHKDLDLEEVRQQISSLAERLKKMGEEFNQILDNALPEGEEEEEEEEEDDNVAAVSSTIDFGVEMVGLSHELLDIINNVLLVTRPSEFGVFSIIGVPGTGRSVVAKMVFEDLCINGEGNYFDCGAWVTIGPKYQFKETLLSIISQIDDGAGIVDEFLNSEGLDPGYYLFTILKGRRYMIVLDDVPDTQIWVDLRRKFPVQNNGSLVLLTTRYNQVAMRANTFYNVLYQPRPDDQVAEMLRVMAFSKYESWPPELEEAGKKIAENCQGLLIIFVKVLVLLWKIPTSPECWNKIAADKENSIFKLVDDEVLEMCKIKEDIQQLFNLAKQTDETDLNSEPATDDSPSLAPEKLIALPGEVESIKNALFPKRFFRKMEVISLVGMPGIGKTTFAKRIFEDPDMLVYFDHCAWVTLGPKYQSKEILVDILAQIYPVIGKMRMKRDAKLAKDLCTKLSNKRCLIVLDDVWDKEPLLYLEKLFPDIMGKALVTTRLAKVARFEKYDIVRKMSLLNKEESWRLFRKKAFGDDQYDSPELEKAGKRISDYCEGLPLLILTIADVLSKAEKTAEYWNEVADKKNSVIVDAHNAISKVLSPSYKSLPQHLKICFLYMGVFPEKYEIPRSKLINLWIGEGFLEPDLSQNVEDFASECLSELVDRSLFMVRVKGSNFETKTCGLHPVFWHLSNNELVKTKLSHSWKSYGDDSMEDVNSNRRLSIHNGILLGIKDVNSMTSISTTHSLLCNGPPLQYPVPIPLNLRLLRVLEARTIRFYEFPIQVVKLFHLRYLALTCNGKIPASISKLRKLQFLIVIRHLNIKFYGDLSYLPMEIWDMKELKHLQITGSNLPNPKCGAVLPNLLALLDVSAQSCRKGVLKRIPNLKKLRIRIELAPNDNCNPFRCLNRISRIRRLESLKCVVVNPELRSDVVAPPAPRSMFPLGLKKLSLSGLGYPWEYMSIIGSLPNLEVLKLRCYAFQGPMWEIVNPGFRRVKFLLIEDTDLVHWSRTFLSFQVLKHLSIKHCYKLEKFPPYLAESIEMVEIVDCNPSAVTWAKQMDEAYFSNTFGTETYLTTQVHSSWVAGDTQVKNSSRLEAVTLSRIEEVQRSFPIDSSLGFNSIRKADILAKLEKA